MTTLALWMIAFTMCLFVVIFACMGSVERLLLTIIAGNGALSVVMLEAIYRRKP
jgi:hypothetical protein